MIRVIWALMALVITPAAAQNWQAGVSVYTRAPGTSEQFGFFLNTHTPKAIPGQCRTPSKWCTIDLTTIGVPATAQAAFLSGILIITPGSRAEICDLHITFRAPGETLNAGDYQMQTALVSPTSTSRSNASVWVPLVGGKFQLYWYGTPQAGDWPRYCSYGANLKVQAYTMGASTMPVGPLSTPKAKVR
jgi:hypothetical protein